MHSDPLTRRAILALAAGATLAVAFAGSAWAQAPSQPARIGIIGAGNIGGTLGGLWARAGHQVMLSSRHPEDLKSLVEGLGPNARAGTPAEAIAFGDVVLVAVPYKAYPQIALDHGAALKGKIVIDAGNATQARDGEVYGEVQAGGIAAVSAKYLAGARIVRAFNAANYKLFAKNAHREGGRMAIPLAGDDPKAVAEVSKLVTDAGFDPVVVGPLATADSFAMGSPGFGLELTAPDLRARFGVTP
ncbi:NADP oxidoreductase [Methylobacterium sp. Leaf104]|uniref:NADPH-dependent F420 reductase n=1 Tax=Methylobacterium TaxID=407 RepID=UPI00070154A2|nr:MULTISPECIES: NAD(P)-binding domain-containing protein [Methylobacterium]KQP36404.1 NADP oxidoreductase [Methylobacterium sp. Leaf104]MCI9878425.1 NAD(P)-binding domain-containing protein [Methylobacterium goesingense]